MFTAIARDETALGHPISAATLHCVHATPRGCGAALNGAVGVSEVAGMRASALGDGKRGGSGGAAGRVGQ
jgi:hypothetical protein